MADARGEMKYDYDVIVIGAGICGINAGYRIQESLPNFSYTILESRHEIGGTWSLFKYPGIRSDSDLYTFGFAFDPWNEARSIAPASSILNYLRTVSNRHGIDKNIKFHHNVLSLDWSTELQKWRIKTQINGGDKKMFSARYVIMSTGYYDYNEGLPSRVPGIENFNGTVVHPQFWPEDLDYVGKKTVIIGSGATAVTLLPAMHEAGAGHVTMLQRSPGYFVNLPSITPIDNFIRTWLPLSLSHRLIRLRTLISTYIFFNFCQIFPKQAIKLIRSDTEKQLPPHIPIDPHFIPAYNPWDQRICVTTNGDFFQALHSGKADIVTGHIETVTSKGIQLKSGQFLDADIIITATGLKVQTCGGATLAVDGKDICIGDKFIWRGSMLQDVPNLAFFMGYTNASWTLGSDATARLFVRLLADMEKRGTTSVMPTVNDPGSMKPVQMLNLSSNWLQAGIRRKQFPMGGNVAPWKPRRNYFVDSWFASFGSLTNGLVFNRASS